MLIASAALCQKLSIIWKKELAQHYFFYFKRKISIIHSQINVNVVGTSNTYGSALILPVLFDKQESIADR